MLADDEGFVNSPKKIQRMIGAAEDDLKLLITKKFVLPFESGVIVIKHWKINNYLQKDRFKKSVYEQEKTQLYLKKNNAYTLDSGKGTSLCIHSVYSLDTQYRIGEDSIGKDSIVEDSKEKIIAETTKHYEDNIGALVPTTAMILLDLIDTYNKDLIKKAIDIACIRNVRRIDYVEGILKDWNKKGYKVLADIQQEQRGGKNGSNAKSDGTEYAEFS